MPGHGRGTRTTRSPRGERLRLGAPPAIPRGLEGTHVPKAGAGGGEERKRCPKAVGEGKDEGLLALEIWGVTEAWGQWGTAGGEPRPLHGGTVPLPGSSPPPPPRTSPPAPRPPGDAPPGWGDRGRQGYPQCPLWGRGWGVRACTRTPSRGVGRA